MHPTRHPDGTTGARRRAARLVAFAALLWALALPALAQPGAPAAPAADELTAFFDERVPALLGEHRVPGLIVAVVADGEVRLATGYGLAELEPDRPADADTPFATGSVAKLFVWTAVMQLVERGELDLDSDVNDYLDFEIPTYGGDGGAGGEPITLRHLMAHTPGFEDYPLIGLFARDAEGLPELGEVLAARIPERVRAPGVESAYSNYGSALAGYVVERASGVPFAAYVEREILEPLAMARSSFRQPLPPGMAEVAAVGYAPAGDDAGDGFVALGAEYVALVPAGGMVMSAADAARFMLAHLQGGAVDGARILEPETVERMHGTLFRADPALPGNAHGFWESERHGERILQHGGDTQLFHTQFALLLGAGALLLSALIALPLLAWLARRRRDANGVAARRTRWLGLAAALLGLAFVGLIFVAMADPMGPAFGVSPLLAAGLAVGIVAALAIAVYAVAVIFAWLLGWWRTGERIYATVLAVAGLALLWQMEYWNLLGFRI